MTRTPASIYLAIVGCAYLLLAVWCSVAPEQTSRSVGFVLNPGSGQSEYLVVYGGLELALGVFFLGPLFRENETDVALRFCVLLHGCLVLFRSIGFLAFSGIGPTTYVLAGVEWAIFLGGAAVVSRRP